MLARRFEDVLAITAHDSDHDAQMDRAGATVIGGAGEGPDGAVEFLRATFQADGEDRKRAAFLLLCAAANNPNIAWDEEAEGVIGEDSPLTVAILHAECLASEGEIPAAEALLTPHADQPDALRLLVHLALTEGRLDRAARLADTLAQRTGAPRDQLLQAGIDARAGDHDAAVDRLRAIARDPGASFDESSAAYQRACELLLQDARFGEAERLGREWAQRDPRGNPRWVVVLALTMRFKYAEALTAWRELDEPDPDTETRALLLGEAFAFAAAPDQALQQLAELSDRYGRPEQLECSLMFTALRVGGQIGQSVSDELNARIVESFSTFPQRFPNSSRLQAIPIDLTDPAASLVAALQDQLNGRAGQTAALAKGVQSGSTAVALLASAAGRSVGEILLRLSALPLRYADEQLDRLERADAAAAIEAGGAVWDSAAIFVMGGLAGRVQPAVRAALPASLVAHATQQDAARDVIGAAEGERAELSVIGGVVHVVEWSSSDRATDEARARGMLELATELQIGSLGEASDELNGVATGEHPLPVRSWAATLAVARHNNLPVFSDDRVVRQSARAIGLRAFGTTTLLELLVERGTLAPEVRDRARQRLLAHGAWGMEHSIVELEGLGRCAAWEPSDGVRAALGDVSAWIGLRSQWATRIIGFLDTVAREAPDELGAWAHRAVDAMADALGGDYERHAVILLVFALNPTVDPPRMPDDHLQALLQALREIPYFRYFPPRTDLLISATAALLRPVAGYPPGGAAVFQRVSVRLSPTDQGLLQATFVR